MYRLDKLSVEEGTGSTCLIGWLWETSRCQPPSPLTLSSENPSRTVHSDRSIDRDEQFKGSSFFPLLKITIWRFPHQSREQFTQQTVMVATVRLLPIRLSLIQFPLPLCQLFICIWRLFYVTVFSSPQRKGILGLTSPAPLASLHTFAARHPHLGPTPLLHLHLCSQIVTSYWLPHGNPLQCQIYISEFLTLQHSALFRVWCHSIVLSSEFLALSF